MEEALQVHILLDEVPVLNSDGMRIIFLRLISLIALLARVRKLCRVSI